LTLSLPVSVSLPEVVNDAPIRQRKEKKKKKKKKKKRRAPQK